MPKLVDHEARRRELLEALLRITSADGWDAITLRRIAAEAGVSVGMVQHYFTSKDEILRFAIEMTAEDTRQRVRQRIAELPPPRTPRLLTETVLTEMVPNTSRRAIEATAASVWVRRFLLQPENQAPDELTIALTGQIRLGRGGTPEDAERDAAGLVALLDGLICSMVAGRQTTESAIAILRAQIGYVFNA
jgi:AcrR family transcriptional regulator